MCPMADSLFSKFHFLVRLWFLAHEGADKLLGLIKLVFGYVSHEEAGAL